MSIRTPLSRVRGLGSAKSGTDTWWLERMTGLANLPLNLFLVIFVVMHVGAARSEVIASIRNPFVAGLLVLSFIAIAWHMRLGMRAIIEDYAHGHATRVVLLLLNTIFTVVLALVAILAILKMSLAS